MKKLLIIALLMMAGNFFPGNVGAVTDMTCASGSCEWNTAGNWSAGIPGSVDDATFTGVAAGTTITGTTTAIAAKSIDFSGAAGPFTFSGSVPVTVQGSLTLKTGMAWNESGALVVNGAGTITSNGVSLSSISSFRITGAAVQLGDAINTGTKSIYVNAASTTFTSNNNQITCGVFGDNSVSGAITLTLGSSVINNTNTNFCTATLTVTANTATFNTLQATNPNTCFGSNKTWGGALNLTLAGNGASTIFYNTGTLTFQNMSLILSPSDGTYNGIGLHQNFTIPGTFSITGNLDPVFRNVRGTISGWGGIGVDTTGTPMTITAGTLNASGTFNVRDIAGVCSGTGGLCSGGSWNLAEINSGNAGGNTGIAFRAHNNYYLNCGTQSCQDYGTNGPIYDPVYATTSGGTPSASIVPLPQDTLIIDDGSFVGTGQSFVFHSGGRTGKVNASGLTKSNSISLPRGILGDLDYTGSGVSFGSHTGATTGVDARLEYETDGSPLDINIIAPTVGATVFNVGTAGSAGPSVRLLHDFTFGVTGAPTLDKGVFNLNGYNLIAPTFVSSQSVARTLNAGSGGGLVLTGLTGTLFDTTTATNLTISNAPSITIAPSAAQTGDVTFIGSGKTYGNFTVKKHAGNLAGVGYKAIINEANTFSKIILEPADATYQYTKLAFKAGVTTIATNGIQSFGNASYPSAITSSTAAAHTLSSGTSSIVTNTNISYSTAAGTAQYWFAPTYFGCTDGGNNTVWDFSAKKRIF